jgi:hypothetical protein
MVSQGFLIEKTKPIAGTNGIVPQNITGAAKATAWIGLKQGRKLRFVILGGAWAGGTPAVTLTQASDAAGTGDKALAFTRHFTVSGDTVTEVAVTSNTFNLADAANQMVIIEVDASDLDVNNNFSYVKLNIASPGANADFLAVFAEVYDLLHSGKPSTLPTVLT